MSDVRLQGGRDGKYLNVDTDGRAQVVALSRMPFVDAAVRGNAYSLMVDHTLSGTLEEVILWMKNLDTQVVNGRVRMLVMDMMMISSTGDVDASFCFGDMRVSGGTQVVSVNMNGASAKNAPIEVFGGNPTLDGSGSCASKVYLSPRMVLAGRESFLAPEGGTFAVKVTGSAGVKVSLNVKFYFVPLEC